MHGNQGEWGGSCGCGGGGHHGHHGGGYGQRCSCGCGCSCHQGGGCGCSCHQGGGHHGGGSCGQQGCSCGGGSDAPRLQRRFFSKQERSGDLEAYLRDLEAEAQAVREALASGGGQQ